MLKLLERTLTVGGSITYRTASLQFYKCGLNRFTSYKQKHIFRFSQFQSCQIGDQPYGDPSPNFECSLHCDQIWQNFATLAKVYW